MRTYSHARHAIAVWARDHGTLDGTLYVPAYICAEAMEPLEDMGQRISYYPVSGTLEPDWSWLESHQEANGKTFLLVHYFGFPNAIDRALDFCRQRDLALLEDCAHSFLTRHQGQTIGTFGDAGFYSFHKMLPIPNGGGMLDKGAGNGVSSVAGVGGLPYREMVRRLAEYSLHRAGVPARLWQWLHGGYSRVGRGSGQAPVSPMAGISRQIMRALEPRFGLIEARRRENYRRLVEEFRAFPEVVQLYPDLPEGVCPYTFPILVPDRDQLIEQLQAMGVPAQSWPILPGDVVGKPEFAVANRYAAELMMLPVHQDLSSRDMDRMVGAYRRVRRAVPVKT